MAFAWTGRILRVDLTTGSSHREDLPRQLLEEYLGGRGLGVRLMRDYFRLDPFDPAMSFAAQLHRDLTARGFEVWFDRMAIPSRGLTFHQEIQDAVAARERLGERQMKTYPSWRIRCMEGVGVCVCNESA